MDVGRFEKLAEELAGQDPELPARLCATRVGAQRLRALAAEAVEAFRRRAGALGADHLTDLSVSELLPDEKHVDCLQFVLTRGRWRLICVAIAEAPPRVRVVGPFKQGKEEGPCSDFPLDSPVAEAALEERAIALIRQACE